MRAVVFFFGFCVEGEALCGTSGEGGFVVRVELGVMGMLLRSAVKYRHRACAWSLVYLCIFVYTLDIRFVFYNQTTFCGKCASVRRPCAAAP